MQGIDLFTHLLLPTIAIVLISFASYTRYSRASLLEVMNQDYIRTARAKGLTQRTVDRAPRVPQRADPDHDDHRVRRRRPHRRRGRHRDGLRLDRHGRDCSSTVSSHVDPNPVMAFFVVTGTLAVLFNLIADLVYAGLDPRIKVG